MERIEKLNRNQVLKELQSYHKYQSKTQKEIAGDFDGVVALRNELKKLEKRKNKKDENENEKVKTKKDKKKNQDEKDKKKKQDENEIVKDKKEKKKQDVNDNQDTDCLVLLIWERKDRGDDVSTILLARDVTMLKRKFKDYFIKHREDEDYLEDDDFEEYSNNAVNMLDKMSDNDTEAPEFNSADIITLKHSTL